MNKDDGGPAFPVVEVFDERRGETTQYGSAGMSLRDYFAAKIMTTIMIGAVLPTKADRDEHVQRAAQVAYEMADAPPAASGSAPG